MLVKDIMSKDIVSVSPEDNVSELISLIEKHCFREILIIENKKLKGIVYSKEIAKKGIVDPTKTKVHKLMRFPPPTLSPSQDIDEVAKLIFKTGLRALPVLDDDKVVGIVSMHDIIDTASGTRDFRQTTSESIMSNPEIITEDTDVGKARVLMREKNISRIPVVDKNQKLNGVVTIFDLLRAIKPRERMGFYSMAAEEETLMGIPVSVVMNNAPTTVNKDTSLNEIVSMMRKNETDGVIVVEKDSPIGVVTEKDLLEFYVSGLKREGVYYQIIGLGDEDEFIVETVDRMIRDTIQKLSKIFKPQFFVLHIKRYDRKGRIKYSIRTRFLTTKGTFVSKSHDWDLRDAANDALRKLERIMLKEKGEIMSKTRGMSRFKKMYE